MPRPTKCRRICELPRRERFGPLDGPPEDAVEMTVDEYEVIRLIDLLDYTQEECAAQIGVARTAVQTVYDRARGKLADALVNGRMLTIRGGEYALCAHADHCCGRNCKKRCCEKRRCQLLDGGHYDENCGHL